MQLSKDEKNEIAEMAVNLLIKHYEHKTSLNWLSLKKEIKKWCQDQEDPTDIHSIRWCTLQTKVYDSIRVVLNISRVDDMTDEQAIEAKKSV